MFIVDILMSVAGYAIMIALVVLLCPFAYLSEYAGKIWTVPGYFIGFYGLYFNKTFSVRAECVPDPLLNIFRSGFGNMIKSFFLWYISLWTNSGMHIVLRCLLIYIFTCIVLLLTAFYFSPGLMFLLMLVNIAAAAVRQFRKEPPRKQYYPGLFSEIGKIYSIPGN